MKVEASASVESLSYRTVEGLGSTWSLAGCDSLVPGLHTAMMRGKRQKAIDAAVS